MWTGVLVLEHLSRATRSHGVLLLHHYYIRVYKWKSDFFHGPGIIGSLGGRYCREGILTRQSLGKGGFFALDNLRVERRFRMGLVFGTKQDFILVTSPIGAAK
jgi:hypothetical protein